MPKLGFGPLTPPSGSPIASFSFEGVGKRFVPALSAAKVKISVYENMVRISPSVYNGMEDIEKPVPEIVTGDGGGRSQADTSVVRHDLSKH